MIEINYKESLIKKVGNFGFEIIEMVGEYNKEKFKITLSTSPRVQNNEAKCIEGDLKRNQITDVLKKFDYMECKTKEIVI